MALLWFDGFDWLATPTQGNTLSDELDKYYLFHEFGASASNGVVDNPNVDRSGNALQFGNSHYIRTQKLRETGSSTSNVCIIGFFLRTPASFSNNSRFIEIWSQAGIQCLIEVDSGGTLEHKRGAVTSVATSSYAFDTENDYYVEFKVTIDSSAGAIEMWVADLTAGDESTGPEWSATGLNNEALTSDDEHGWDQIEINEIGSGMMIDDLYICDGSGSANNDFLGNTIVPTITPSAEGANSDFSPSTGTDNSALVDETAPSDEDATYVESSTNGDIDTYVMTDLSGVVGEVAGVMVTAEVRVTEADPRTIRLPVKSGSTTSEGSNQVIGTDEYRPRHRILETDPDSGSAWTTAGVNGIEVGVKRQG